MLHKRMFKVLSPIPKRDGAGSWWMRVGSAFTNKDDSINIYLDAVPRDLKFTLRELDEADLRQRSPAAERIAPGPSQPELGTPTPF